MSIQLFEHTPIIYAQVVTGSNETDPPVVTGSNETDSNDISTTLANPLANGGVNDIPTLIQKILEIVITIGVPIVALAIIYAGFQFVAARGNPEKLKRAKETLLYVIIGAAILLGAYVIAEAIGATVEAIRGN
ncbi:TrbC/VirB2 family protein [Patescibacteria group bacterium]|nr:TrbC/VirB2 family protein [Patescibacteria group bacterium]